MSELKRCPFCGGEAKLNTFAMFTCNAQVRCKKCGARTLEFSSATGEDAKLNAINSWNTRKPVESILERLEELSRQSWVGEYDAIETAIEIIKEEVG